MTKKDWLNYCSRIENIREQTYKRNKLEQDFYNDIYKGPIYAYPIREITVNEALQLSYPTGKFIKKLEELNIPETLIKLYYIDFPNPLKNCKECSGIRIITTEKYFELYKDKIEVICEFFGYYINHKDTDDQDYPNQVIYYIYPKIQASFLLKEEKFLLHFTSARYLQKIKKQGLKPTSKKTKLENIKNYSHSEEYTKYYNAVKTAWSCYNHPDKIHFFVGSAVSIYLQPQFITNLFNTFQEDLVCILIDVSKIRNIAFCLDPNNVSEKNHQRITIYTLENIPPQAILNFQELLFEENTKEAGKKAYVLTRNLINKHD